MNKETKIVLAVVLVASAATAYFLFFHKPSMTPTAGSIFSTFSGIGHAVTSPTFETRSGLGHF